jgi:hypothetical protein
MSWWKIALQAVGTVVSMMEAKAQGREDQSVAEANAIGREKQASAYDRAAQRERASGQREAREERHKGRLATSRAQAVAAASGGGVSDPSVQANMDELEARSQYNALSALYESEEQAIGLEDEAVIARYGADVQRYEGRIAKRRAKGKAVSNLISGATSMAETYSNMTKPK